MSPIYHLASSTQLLHGDSPLLIAYPIYYRAKTLHTSPLEHFASPRFEVYGLRLWEGILKKACRLDIMGDSAYSFSLTTFSPSGKLLQIEYALARVAEGKTALGIVGKSPFTKFTSPSLLFLNA